MKIDKLYELDLGIIYSPNPGNRRLWKKMHRYLKERDVRFDYVRSESSADTERLTAMMVRSGYRNIIVAGGDSALGYALRALMTTPSPHGVRPNLGVLPAGYGNDFAAYWGMERKNYRENIDRLLRRRTRRIDVGRVVARKDGEEQTDYFLDCLNIGVAASIINMNRLTRSILWARSLAYLASAFILLFRRMSFHLGFSIDGAVHDRRAMTLCIGSAGGYGQTPSAVPYNGLLDVSLVSSPLATQLLHGLWLLTTGRFLSHRGISVWRTRRVDFHHPGRAEISLDGRRGVSHADSFVVDILPEEISFLIP